MTSTALLIGFARTIELVLTDGQVIDTLIHAIAQPLAQVGSGLLQWACWPCRVSVTSSSRPGPARPTSPCRSWLRHADLTGLTRQTSVLAYQMGDGFMNMVVPTNALLMGMLGLGRIPYTRWLSFIVPLLVKLFVVAVAALLIAVAIGYE